MIAGLTMIYVSFRLRIFPIFRQKTYLHMMIEVQECLLMMQEVIHDFCSHETLLHGKKKTFFKKLFF